MSGPRLSGLNIVRNPRGKVSNQLAGTGIERIVHPRQRRGDGDGKHRLAAGEENGGRHASQTRAEHLIVERVAREMLTARNGRPASSNVDFYSGFLYQMLGLPQELFTPLFAIARMPGWCAHRMEELSEGGKIIRPACKCIERRRPYVPMENR